MANLPTPSNEALAHSNRLKQQLIAHIRQQAKKNISFAEFMQLALYTPGLGYYAAGSRKFGKDGDFITAPELSSHFAHCLARQTIEIFNTIDCQAIVEIGAGSGIMAADILLYLEQTHQLPTHYYILEASPELQQRQHETLNKKAPHLAERVQWLTQLPTDFSGVILANELLDALPVHIFEITEAAVFERCIGAEDDELCWINQPASDPLQQAIKALQAYQPSLKAPYVSEINLALPNYLHDLSQCLQKGVILLVDYGFPQNEYYHPTRNTGTLMCHYRHRSHTNPLLYLGLQDITAHVDFTAVALAGVNNGLDLLGYTNQASFLLNTGLLTNTKHNNEKSRLEDNNAIKMLTLPSEMGELFKVLALGKHYPADLSGFKTQDLSHRL